MGEAVLENVKVVRTCTQCPVYDNLEEELKEMNNQGGGTT